MGYKLTAIICLWDGEEFLPYLVPNLQEQVDEILIVYSRTSNFGERLDYPLPKFERTRYINFEPIQSHGPHTNETRKRNFGLRLAINEGATHVLMCDVDEFYDTHEFNAEKERIYSSGINGLVCGLRCYFGLPDLFIDTDKTRVPFIQKITPKMEVGFFKHYPFSYENGDARIDPTRRPNTRDGVEWSEITMHHYSWVRNDILRKIKNSSARINILKSTALEDYRAAKEGYFCKYYNTTLQKTDIKFGIKV